MKKVANVKELTHEEWLRLRKKGITGTDAGAIVGMNPYVSAMDVFNDKRGDALELIDNEAMRQGRELEEYVAQRFMEETGKKVRRANFLYQNDKHPWMLADFDRLIVGEEAGLECKTVSPYSQDKWKDGKIPFQYQMQVQHYLAVSGYKCWYIAALVFGREFIVRRIERDEELIQNLITIEERFWKDNVLSGIMPEPDGSSVYNETIANMYAYSKEDKTIHLMGLDMELNRRKELEELIDKLDREKDEIDQRIKLQMQDAAYAETDNFRISWVSSQSQRIDTKKLKEEAPDIYSQYCKTVNSRRFMVKAA